MKNPSIFGSSQKRGVLIPICSRFESVTFRESEAILTLPEVCQQSETAQTMRRQIDEKPLDFWQQSKTRGFDSDLFTF
ncbi:hypothetical protein B3286c1_1214 [Brucella vulpis]|uniref:hypothetical protein n=1 Tax=Brucella vulpis TaxID=981386 RepID=UPI00073AC0C9|nr:hypothetical protein B3286c1_1214 [Brucella vulpis]